MNEYALVQDGVVINLIYWDGADWEPNTGVTAVLLNGVTAGIGYTYTQGVFTAPASAESLAQAQATQIAALYDAYNVTIGEGVTYTSKGGVTESYQSDPASINDVMQMQAAFQSTGTMPSGFYWVATNNVQVPFTYADVQGLANAMGLLGVASFAQLQTLKAQVNAATTVPDVQSVAW